MKNLYILTIVCALFLGACSTQYDYNESKNKNSEKVEYNQLLPEEKNPQSQMEQKEQTPNEKTTNHKEEKEHEPKQKELNSTVPIKKPPTENSFQNEPPAVPSALENDVTDTNSPNFDPYHKDGYIYVPGEGYIEAGEGNGASGVQDAMGGQNFWDILNDPNNKQIGY